MNEILIVTLLVVSIFALLGCGVWVGLTLAGTAWIGMEVLSSRPAGDAMAVTIWGASSSWTLTACRCSCGWARSCSAPACPRTCSRASRRG
ncbi:hypothetical protein ACL7CG_18345 (plasmid) [Bordetella pertussis]